MKFKIMRPNTMNKYGAVLDDFGLEAMLNKFMEQFIAPISRGCLNALNIYKEGETRHLFSS